MKIIGLTGGIGAGKSTVSDYLRSKGYNVIDADKISHDITVKGSPVLESIVEIFGKAILLTDGNLDRKKMANIVFNDEEKKKNLEELTTKVVIDMIKNQLNYLREAGTYDIIFVDAPLLFETGANKLTDCVWLVDAELDIRINRVMERDKTSYNQVLLRINHQMSSDIKKSMSKEIIDNSKGKEALYKQIEALLTKYDRKTKGTKSI